MGRTAAWTAAAWLALAPAVMAQAQADAEPAYSPTYKACMTETGEVDFKIAECANAELDRQDKVLNATYRKLTAATEAKFRPDLLKAERAWLAFRDAQCGFEFAPSAQATEGRVFYSDCMLKMTYERVKKLQDMLAIAKFAQ